MIDQIDRQLVEWVRTVTGAEVTVGLPNASPAGRGVNLYLHEFGEMPPARTSDRPPVQVWLRYLVSAWGETTEDMHHTLAQVLIAAMQVSEYRVDLCPAQLLFWSSLNLAPRPAFLLGVPLRHERPKVTPRLVQTAVVQAAPSVTLSGRVVGPNDLPLAGIQVELPALNRVAETDRSGLFRFATVPQVPLLLRLSGRGQVWTVEVQPAGEPVIVHFEPGKD